MIWSSGIEKSFYILQTFWSNLSSRILPKEAARIRAAHISLRTPDAIHLATAITSGARYFLTNDKGLPALPNLQMLLVDNLVQT